ncbi:MAG TPA: cytochrome c [Bryobacteraceae bacterium]|nr:cytochrome c [Bryobacteraceae bacterium]
MRRFALIAAACACLFGATDEVSFQKEMKEINEHAGVLRKTTPRTGAEVAAHAEKIAELYEAQKTFWSERKADDAIKLAEDGKAAALQLATAAKAGDAAAADVAFKAVGGTCSGCHMAHREKLADGTYKIK